MRVDGWEVEAVLEGTFLLDGGSMFGVVPKPLWAKHHPADEKNRIVMALRCLLLTGHGRTLLIDCGIGERFSAKQQEIYRHERPQGSLTGALRASGVEPAAVTDVIASHLHFDHMGGLLGPDPAGALQPAFPNATVHLQEAGWRWAKNPSALDQGSYFEQDFPIWEERCRLNLVSGAAEIAPGIRVQETAGHTAGHQIVWIGERGGLLYCADLIPTATHIRLPYIMAYDHRPLQTLEEKTAALGRAHREDRILVFEHDPFTVACRLAEKGGALVQGEAITL